MGMSSWVIDCEEKFCDIVATAIENAEHVTEVYPVARANRNLVEHWSDNEVTACVDEFWNEFWSNYV